MDFTFDSRTLQPHVTHMYVNELRHTHKHIRRPTYVRTDRHKLLDPPLIMGVYEHHHGRLILQAFQHDSSLWDTFDVLVVGVNGPRARPSFLRIELS